MKTARRADPSRVILTAKMPNSGPSGPGRPVRGGPGAIPPAPPSGKGSGFDGDEPTEVMAVPHARQPEPEPEPENRDKQYVAPCEIPAARVPDKELEGAKVVLNIPDATRGRGVAEERARRRAPTVKIARADVETAVIRPVGGRDELTVPDQAAIRIPIDVTIDDPDLLADIHAQSGGATPRPGYIAPARPISDSPPARRGQSSRPPSSGRALE
ncbi:MAG: hypothetical protein HOW73_42280, partial [Polyangiaceae bacterium]|nr:hypothetical protein [Polyangiaceae bacterium]